MHETFQYEQTEGVHYVNLYIAPTEIINKQDKEAYLFRNSANFNKHWDTLEIKHIFESNSDAPETPRSVIVLAGPGMGKTTATQERDYSWGCMPEDVQPANMAMIHETKAMFRYECRHLSKGEYSLADLIQKHGPHVDTEDLEEHIRMLDCSGTEIIFDGLDELDDFGDTFELIDDIRDKTTLANLIKNLIKGNLLPNARILCSSRPNESIRLEDFHRLVVALGFSKDSISDCMLSLCNNDDDKHKRIMDHIGATQLGVHCFVPLTCVLVGIILLNDMKTQSEAKGCNNQITIDTFTDLYIKLTLQILHKGQKRKRNKYKLTHKRKQSLKHLINLAADGIFADKRKIIFDGEDLDKHKITNDDIRSLMLECVCEDKPLCLMDAWKPTVASFIHLTYQEFLAAVYIALDKDNTNLERLVTEMSSGRFEMVLLFTAGLLGNKDQGHKFLNGIDSSVTTDMLSLKADSLLQSLDKLVLSEDLEKREDFTDPDIGVSG